LQICLPCPPFCPPSHLPCPPHACPCPAQVYDPPQKLLKRHNELHIPVGKKKEEQKDATAEF